tara:strand:- start:6628 stop:7254 length:627 start_codon:yes stop_codon:yes gene_type:complete
MKFNGQLLILIGSILFIFQIVNFISINLITPELQRAQVLAAISSIVIILIGLLFERFIPISGEKIKLEGENNFIYDEGIPNDLVNELAWGSEAILTSTAAASILINHKGKNILKRGLISNEEFIPGESCLRSIKEMRLISLANTKFYPGRNEFDKFCLRVPSILIVPINNESFILIGGWSSRCFTKSDEKWINNWAKKLSSILNNSIF